MFTYEQGTRMSFEGVCQICESAPAVHVCTQCGNNVCDAHFDRGLSICDRCASTVRQGGEGGPGDDSRPMR